MSEQDLGRVRKVGQEDQVSEDVLISANQDHLETINPLLVPPRRRGYRKIRGTVIPDDPWRGVAEALMHVPAHKLAVSVPSRPELDI